MYWIIFIIILCCYILSFYIKKAQEKKEKQNLLIQTEQITNSIKIDIENLTEEEYKKKLLQQIQSINMNLVELQFQILKQDKRFKEIENNVSIIAAILIIPIAIGIIAVLLSIVSGENILQNLL